VKIELTEQEALALSYFLAKFQWFLATERPGLANDPTSVRLWNVAKKIYVASGCRAEHEPASFVRGDGNAA
jgi:hypothetical protein